MGMKVKETGGGSYKPAPAGLHRAVCVSYVDIGTHESEFQGETKRQSKVMLTWELPDETMTIEGETKPMTVSKFYTKSLHEKSNLRHDLASWRTRDFTPEELKGFDLDNILGKPCQVNIVHEQKQAGLRSKITAVLPLSKGMIKPEPSITPWKYSIDEDGYRFPEQLSDKMKELIKKSEEMTVVNDLPGNPYGEQDQFTMEQLQDDIGAIDAMDDMSDSLPF